MTLPRQNIFLPHTKEKLLPTPTGIVDRDGNEFSSTGGLIDFRFQKTSLKVIQVQSPGTKIMS